MKEIYILGIGHNTPVFIELAESCGFTVKGLYHYTDGLTGKVEHGYTVLGNYDDLWKMPSLDGMNFALSQGDNIIRKDIFEKITAKGGNIPTLVHPSAVVSRYAKLGKGVAIHPGAILHPYVVIGDNTIVSEHTCITHNTTIGDDCFLAFGAKIGAYVKIDNGVFIGIGAIIISGKVDTIGNNAYVAAGALVTKSVKPYTVVAGLPAKVMKLLPHSD